MLISIVLATGCYYDSAEKLYPNTDCVSVRMSMQADILPILQDHCYACHSAAVSNGNITLEGYNELIKNINGGRFLGSIKREPGFKQMPQNEPKLSSCEISKIEQWILDGAQNN